MYLKKLFWLLNQPVDSFIVEYLSEMETKGNLWKVASMFKFEFKLNVIDSFVEPSDQPVNSYPSSAVALTVTSVPSSYSPPSLDILPPSPALTVSV